MIIYLFFVEKQNGVGNHKLKYYVEYYITFLKCIRFKKLHMYSVFQMLLATQNAQ
jgi:hypothetical protein